MNLGARQHLVTATAFAAIGTIAAAIWSASTDVGDAERERRHATEIAQGLGELRLVAFEYIYHREERARVQRQAVVARLDRLIAEERFTGTVQKEILANLRQKRASALRTFDEMTAAPAATGAGAPRDAAGRRYEAQLFSRLLIDQQDNIADAFLLTGLANQRISAAQRRLTIVIFAGLALIALVTGGGSWLIHRAVLSPVMRLQRATQLVAAGDLEVSLGMSRDDEIGEMAANFDRMVRSLRASFAQIERSNHKLAAAEERFRATVESAPMAIVMADQAGRIVLVNAQTEALFGYTRDELLGQMVELLVPQGARAAHPARREEFLARPHVRPIGSGHCLHALRKDGTQFPAEIGLNPIRMAEGLFVLAAIADITERRQAEDEIRQLNEALVLRAAQLETANKELESFSYSVSHDLRAPLRSMDGFSLQLLEDYGDKLDDEGKDALHRIRAASQRMGRLIDDLLELSRVNRAELRLARVNLSALTRAIADSLAQADPGRAVQWEIEPGVSLESDPALIEIALRNLLENAWKFTGKTARPLIRVGARAVNGAKSFFVADNGAGFDMAHASRLFEPFQRLHGAADFPGTGIGLAIVQRVIRRHGGEIRAEAAPGKGATFFFSMGKQEEKSRG